MKQCDNGHFYDEMRFNSCPYCVGGNVGETVAIDSNAGRNNAAAQSQDEGKTVGFFSSKDYKSEPVVAFLVCISGPHKGEAFNLVSGRNFIGRSTSMDVALVNDEHVSRENHTIVSYDGKHNNFTVSPGMGRGITYCNDVQIELATRLNSRDVLEIGNCKLLFLPICCDDFKWDEE